MANCHDLFILFNESISIPSTKKKKLKKAKDALETKIKNYFAKNHPSFTPKFFIQGSYKSHSGVIYEDGTCDLDNGVYFLEKPEVEAETIQKWVLDAVSGHTTGGQQHRKKCIRVVYKDDFNIDIPVLYKTENDAHPFLAVKNIGWVDDDPKEFVEWLNMAKDKNGQLIRIIKYLKIWCDNISNKTPNGLCLTILTEANKSFDDRDDIALLSTLKRIQTRLKIYWTCYMPTYPYENLFSHYNDTVKQNFMNALDLFIKDAEEAIFIDSTYEASKRWQKHLGKRFELFVETEDEEKAKTLYRAAALINSSNSYTTTTGKITDEKIGVKNKENRFFGE